MKRIIFLSIFIALTTCFMVVNVNAETANQEKLGLDKEQAEQLKGQLEGLKEVFGIEKAPQAQPSQNQQQPAQKKTVVDVADKALDMVNKMVADIAATLNNVAPEVWRIMMKQQYAQAISDLIVPWGLLLFSFCYMKAFGRTFGVKWMVKEESDIGDFKRVVGYAIPVCAMVITGIWGIVNLAGSIKILINPEFYAIKNLVLILLGK